MTPSHDPVPVPVPPREGDGGRGRGDLVPDEVGRGGTRWGEVSRPRANRGHQQTITHIRTECAGCGAPLHTHNITRLCAECKLVARNRRLSGKPVDLTEPVTPAQAINNIVNILGGRIISETWADR